MALDFDLSDEQQQMQETARRMLKQFEKRADEIRHAIFVEKRLPEEVWQAFADAGFLGALIPERYGGTEIGLLALQFAMEEMGLRGFASALLVLTVMDTACIVRNGSEEMKKRLLPEIANGKLKLCFALTEPNAGSNTFRIETMAKKDGGSYLLTGQKVFISGADLSDKMLVVARTMTPAEAKAQGLPKAFGMSLFLVDPKAKGVTMRELPMHGVEGARQWHIFFDNAPVPAEDLLGEENAGGLALFNSLNPERILAAGIAVGGTEYVLKKAVQYANERKVFRDTPIGAHQGISHPLAEIKMELESVRMTARRAAWAFDKGLPPMEVAFWANSAKYQAAEMWIKAVDRGIQTLGGYGFSDEFGLIQFWTAARLLRTAPITKEMILNYVAEHTLGLPRSY